MRSRMTSKMEVPKEWQEQVALVQWLSVHPKLKDYFTKNDNEGKRTPQQGFQAKRMGLRPGVLDVFIYYPSPYHTYHGLWLEMKRNKRYTPSEMRTPTWIAQEKFAEQVKGIGYQAHFCYGWLDAKRLIEEYLLT